MTAAPAAVPLRVRVLLFGALRDLAAAPELSLEVPRETTVAALRGHLRDALSRARTAAREGLVESAAIAVDDGILAESEALDRGVDEVRVALLPPVCGG